MEETKWSPVLREIYLHQDSWGSESEAIATLRRGAGIDAGRAEDVLTFLVEMELIERNGDGPRLTTEGFNVIRNREIQEEQVRTNRILLVFTAILALSSLTNLLIAVF